LPAASAVPMTHLLKLPEPLPTQPAPADPPAADAASASVAATQLSIAHLMLASPGFDLVERTATPPPWYESSAIFT
jgi:hypothetical protein